jgi:hypothetical protein
MIYELSDNDHEWALQQIHEIMTESPSELIAQRVFGMSLEDYEVSFNRARTNQNHRDSQDSLPTYEELTRLQRYNPQTDHLNGNRNTVLDLYDFQVERVINALIKRDSKLFEIINVLLSVILALVLITTILAFVIKTF